MHATAGSLIGIGEIVLLPLDVLKIKRQTNPEAFRGRGVFKIVADEGMGLYRGAGWTAARNAPGSFAVRPFIFSFPSRPLTILKDEVMGASRGTCADTNDAITALRRLRLRQGKNLPPDRLQPRDVDAKLRRLHLRRLGLTRRQRAPGRDQDAHPEQEL